MGKCFFEDAVVGYKSSAYEYVVEKQEIIEFASKWDPMPFHIDEAAAKESPYGGLTASGAHIYSILVHLAHKQPRKMAVIAAMGINNMKFAKPVRPGDVLHMEAECLSARESSSKPDRGICNFSFDLINQHGEVVLHIEQAIMLAKKDSGLDVFSRA